MKPTILLINYIENSILDLEKSKFYDRMEFKTIALDKDLYFPASKPFPDILVIFIPEGNPGCLEKVATITKPFIHMEILAAVHKNHPETGVRALQRGVSDFFTLPTTQQIFDFYINRSLEHRYLHKHLCFNESCYKSRFARSEKNYKQLFNEVPCFIYVRDRDYQITDSNRKFKEYFGHHTGEYCFGICKNRDEPCTKCPVEQTFKDGNNHASEMEIISSDGVKHIVLSWTAPIKDNNGEMTHALVLLTDITEARRLEDHLTSLGFMIGSISHGIKGLLTSLDGGIYMMDTGFKTNDRGKTKQGLELSRQMTSRIKKLVLDILYYTKTRQMEWNKLSVKQFMEDTISIVTTNARKNNITIDHSLDILTDDDLFEIDEKSLQAAMINILENGIEACIDNPSKKTHTISFRARIDREKVLFRIQDTGLGMEPSALKKVFTIFFSSKGNKGTGLGLFITNKVIQQHRGDIKVKSTPTKGTCFIIKIPRTVPQTARNPRGVAQSD
ncbi:ATP-binding protein [Desulfobacula sp.]|uniref:two-component system sensor histidine kinase NtrB n=1 Tax=Desulfobacula sp. TaxID=2593537 RepID=UPI002627B106|nr:ATP-binding protein [Desulfobacula sp.]